VSATGAVLDVAGLVKHFPAGGGILRGARTVHAVDGVSFSIGQRETLALVGESGSGKSTVARCVLRLVEPTAGTIRLLGHDVTRLPPRRLRPLRRHVQMVFQDFEGSLHPRHTIRWSVREPLLRLGIARGPAAEAAARAAIQEVELDPADFAKFPHQLSGGQQQRVSIARAIAPRPALVVLDEPLSSLDVSVRVQIADLFLALQERHALSYLFISHDLSMVKYLAHRVAVMYLGRIVELGHAGTMFERPLHPYTRALIGSVLPPEPAGALEGPALHGEIPSAVDRPSGCAFASRCPEVIDDCRRAAVELREIMPEHQVACIRVGA
jgi:oligopeptide/dipeptide ABC transporter ATP-binding protein